VEVPDEHRWVVRRVDGQPRLVQVVVQLLQGCELDCGVGIDGDLMKNKGRIIEMKIRRKSCLKTDLFSFLLRPVLVAFWPVEFDCVAEHDDGLHLLLDHQVPEVFGCLCQWSLSADEAAFSVGGLDPVCMDVLPVVELDAICFTAEDVAVSVALRIPE
jgi:hypothetical protein